MKTLLEIQQHIKKMPAKKRATLEAVAADEGVTLVEYLIDLYGWGDSNGTGNVIIIKNSNTGDIIQNA
jgi:homoserine acetyltransferase